MPGHRRAKTKACQIQSQALYEYFRAFKKRKYLSHEALRLCPYCERPTRAGISGRKGLEVSTVELNVREGQQFKEPFASMNPFNCVPFLELDDGTVISESVSVCRYLEELHPEPSLFGSNAAECPIIDVWNRRIEIDGFMPILHSVRNHLPNFKGRVIPGTRSELLQLPAMVERGKDMLKVLLTRIDPQLAKSEFIAGPAISIADITGYFMMSMAKNLEMDIEGPYPNVFRWHQALSKRPSTQNL